MSKIWIINSGNRYRKKTKIYKTQKELLKAISPDSTQEIFEYDLVSSRKASDFFKEKDRDLQLRTVLGELDDFEVCSQEFVSYYIDNAPDGKKIKLYKGYNTYDLSTEKEQNLKLLRKYQSDKSALSAYLVNNKKYFMTCLTTVDWYRALLKCHRFINHIYDSKSWDKDQRKYIIVDNSTEEIRNNFIEARKQLRKKK